VFKFLPGIVLVQVVTIGLVIAAIKWSDYGQFVVIIGLFALIVSLLTSFWFSSLGREMYQDQLANIRENYILEKEQIIINTEREKAAIVNDSFKLRENDIRRAYARANFKVGVVVALAMCAAAVLILAQFVTIGLTVLIAFGSALSGYLMRAKQERVIREIECNTEQRIAKNIERNLLESK
jgi:energy-coupling factor transporter transmembrane protein EcfT